jgi:hypothetical protein
VQDRSRGQNPPRLHQPQSREDRRTEHRWLLLSTFTLLAQFPKSLLQRRKSAVSTPRFS